MIDKTSLAGLFPTDAEIPAEHRLAGPIHQRTYVIDGLLASWSGEVKTVVSPVCTRQADGSITQVEIGSYPVMGIEESDQILEAAVAAYDNGRAARSMVATKESAQSKELLNAIVRDHKSTFINTDFIL